MYIIFAMSWIVDILYAISRFQNNLLGTCSDVVRRSYGTDQPFSFHINLMSSCFLLFFHSLTKSKSCYFFSRLFTTWDVLDEYKASVFLCLKVHYRMDKSLTLQEIEIIPLNSDLEWGK